MSRSHSPAKIRTSPCTRSVTVRDPHPLGTRGLGVGAARSLSSGARARRRWSSVGVAVEPSPGGPPSAVRYQWDADTEILAVSILDPESGMAGGTSLLPLVSGSALREVAGLRAGANGIYSRCRWSSD